MKKTRDRDDASAPETGKAHRGVLPSLLPSGGENELCLSRPPSPKDERWSLPTCVALMAFRGDCFNLFIDLVNQLTF